MSNTFSTLLILILVLSFPISMSAQVSEPESDDDPFLSDPLFNKPIKDWFSSEEIKERARKTRDQFFVQKGVDDQYRDISGYGEYPGLFMLNKTQDMIRFNRVDGFYIGFNESPLTWTSRKYYKLYGSLGYAFGRKEFLYNLGMERYFGISKVFKAGFEYHFVTDSEDAWRVGWDETSLTSFFAGYDFMDYYNRQGASLYTVTRMGNTFEMHIAYRDDLVSSLERNTRYTMFGYKSNYRDNPLLVSLPDDDPQKIQQIVYALKFNPKQRFFGRRFSISGDFVAELSDIFGGFDSDLSYDRIEAEIRTIYRIDPSAILRIRIRGGGVNGNPPAYKYFNLGGISTIRSAGYKEFSGTSMALANIELSLGSHREYQNRDWLDFVSDMDKLRVTVFFDAGWTGGVAPHPSNPIDSFYHFSLSDVKTSAGVGLNANLLRFELAWPTNDFARTPVIWVRLNPTF